MNFSDTKKEKFLFGVNRNIFFLGLVSFFNDFSAEMVQSVMPVFLTVVLGAPAFLVGVLEGTADALASVLKLFSGWVSDKINRRKLPAVLGYVLSVGVRSLLSLTTHFSQVFGLRVIDRIGKGFRDSPRDALIAESASKEELGRSFGFHRSMDTLGAILGPFLAFLILPFIKNDYRELFLISFFIGLFAILSFVFVKEKRLSEEFIPERKEKLNWELLRKNKKFALVVFSLFVFGLGSLPIILVLLRAKEVGMPAGDIPLVYFVYSLFFVLTAVPLGKLADKIGERTVIAAGFFIASISYFGLAVSSNQLSVVLLFASLGIYSAATDGLERVFAAKHVAPSILATGQGFLNMAIGFSSLGAGVVGGFLWTAFGSSVSLFYAGIFSLLGFGFFMWMTKE